MNENENSLENFPIKVLYVSLEPPTSTSYIAYPSHYLVKCKCQN